MNSMKLIVGLGNPGKEYEKTRHNIGYIFIDNYAKSHNIDTWHKKFNGMYAEFLYDDQKIMLLKPLSYMNLSGTVVKKYVDYFNVAIEDVLIISDDTDLNLGSYRLRSKGSCGGHNGLRNIEMLLNTPEYKRLRIGISNNNDIKKKEYVLGALSKKDVDLLSKMFDNINSLLDDFSLLGFDELMNKYNHK